MTTYEPTAGSIAHVEFYTTDIEATRQFFESAFDWGFEEDEALDYTMWRAPNAPGGGLLAKETETEDFPTTLGYIYTDDLEATRAAATEAGGQILEEEVEIPEMGVFSLFEDSGGVVTAAWEDRYQGDSSAGGFPKYTDDPAPGDITHFEFYTGNANATATFVSDVYGWEVESVEDDGYTMLHPPTPPHGGLMTAIDEMPIGTLVYLFVDEAEAACETSKANGAHLLREPFEIEGWGTMAVIEIPGDVSIALWESASGTVEPTGQAAKPAED